MKRLTVRSIGKGKHRAKRIRLAFGRRQQPERFVFVRTADPSLLGFAMPGTTPPPRRRVPLFGILVFLAVILAVVAFGLFKRRGARRPPPVPAESSAPVHLQVTVRFVLAATGHPLTIG
jgi:hypothetical protein